MRLGYRRGSAAKANLILLGLLVFVGVAVSPSMAEVELAAKEGKGTKASTCCKYGGGFYCLNKRRKNN